MSKKLHDIIFRGYSKQENGHWVAICIDLNIVAQGKNNKDALDKCTSMIQEYLEYVCANYRDQFEKMINRPAPKEFFDEYYSIVGQSITKPKQSIPSTICNYEFEPSNLQQYAT